MERVQSRQRRSSCWVVITSSILTVLRVHTNSLLNMEISWCLVLGLFVSFNIVERGEFLKNIFWVSWIYLHALKNFNNIIWALLGSALDCFQCVSIGGNDKACDDPFHNNGSLEYLESPCLGGRKGRDGLFPATACIKINGIYGNYVSLLFLIVILVSIDTQLKNSF